MTSYGRKISDKWQGMCAPTWYMSGIACLISGKKKVSNVSSVLFWKCSAGVSCAFNAVSIDSMLCLHLQQWVLKTMFYAWWVVLETCRKEELSFCLNSLKSSSEKTSVVSSKNVMILFKSFPGLKLNCNDPNMSLSMISSSSIGAILKISTFSESSHMISIMTYYKI